MSADNVRFVELIRHPEDILEFETYYHLDDEIECSIESCRTSHKAGFIVILRTGERARIGHICGKKLLGFATFEQMRRGLQEREKRDILRRLMDSQILILKQP